MKESERHRRFMSTMLSELNHMFLYDKGSERFNVFTSVERARLAGLRNRTAVAPWFSLYPFEDFILGKWFLLRLSRPSDGFWDSLSRFLRR